MCRSVNLPVVKTLETGTNTDNDRLRSNAAYIEAFCGQAHRSCFMDQCKFEIQRLETPAPEGAITPQHELEVGLVAGPG
jgi:hypothetical protein